MAQSSPRATAAPAAGYPREFRLLRACLAGKQVAPRDADGIDWHALLALASRHEVSALLAHRLSAWGPVLPEWVGAELADAAAANRTQAAGLVEETAQATSLLGNAGIRTLALKGPLLGQAILGDAALRYSKDIDLLVAPDDADQAVAALEQAGYTTLKSTATSRHVTLGAAGGGARLELHYRLYAEHGEPEPGFDELWGGRATVSTPHGPVAHLSHRHNLLALVAHGNYHAWARLKWAVDITHLCAAMEEPDVARAIGDAGHSYGARSLAIGIACVGRLLGPTHLPDLQPSPGDALLLRALWPAMIGPMQSPVELPPDHRDAGTALRTLAMHGAAPFLRTLFEPSHLDTEFWRLPAGLRWAYPALRPIRLVWQKGVLKALARRPRPAASPQSPAPLAPGLRLRPAADVVVQEFEGETVLLDMRTETFYGLDGVGLAIWQSLGKHSRLDEVAAELSGVYDVSPEELRADIDAFVAHLRHSGLVEVVPGTGPPSGPST